MNGILMTGEIIWSREDGVAGLASAWVDPIATMRAGLRVQQRRCHTHIARLRGAKVLGLTVAFPLVLLK